MDLTLPAVLSLALLGPVDTSMDSAQESGRLTPELRRSASRKSHVRRLGNATYARKAADEVLDCADQGNLMDYLDALAGDQEFWDDVKKSFPTKAPVSIEEFASRILQAALDMPSLHKTLGKPAAKRCEQGWLAVQSAIRLIQGSGIWRLVADKVVGDEKGTHRVTDLVYDPEYPTELRHLFARALQVEAAAVVIARAEEHSRKLESGLARTLANAWAEGPEHLAAALNDPGALLAWLGRIIYPSNRDAELALIRKWKEAAVASGEGIYFPPLT